MLRIRQPNGTTYENSRFESITFHLKILMPNSKHSDQQEAIFPPVALQPNAGYGLLITEVSLYFLPNIVPVIKPRRMRWAGHVARKDREVCTGFWWGNLRKRDNWRDPGVDVRITLRWIFRKWDVGYGLDWAGLG
jgi:hypothetical protein